MSVEPASGEGMEAVFAVRVSEQNNNAAREVRLLVNNEMDGRHACYVYYDRRQDSFLLVNDSGDGSTRLSQGVAATIENSQCVLQGRKSTAQLSGHELVLHFAITFKPSFLGNQAVYVYAEDAAGARLELQPRGQWLIDQ